MNAKTALLIAAGLAGLLFAQTSTAAIHQQIIFNFDPDPTVFGDDTQADDGITGATEADIDRALFAALNGPGYSAIGSVGEFGNYGVSGSIFRPGTLTAQVFIEADVTAPPFGSPRNAEARFIIDGGALHFLAGPLSTLDLNLSLSVDFGTVFQTGIQLTGDDAAGNPGFTTFGADIGATRDPVLGWRIEIPFSFQTVDLGVLNPGQTIQFSYLLNIEATIVDYAEVVAFEFQDPLTIEPSPVAPEALRAGIAPVPVPAAAWLFAPAAALLGLRRRRGLTAQDNP